MFRDGTQSQRREEGQRGENVHHEHQDDSEADGAGAQGAGGLVDEVLFHQRAGNGQLPVIFISLFAGNSLQNALEPNKDIHKDCCHSPRLKWGVAIKFYLDFTSKR